MPWSLDDISIYRYFEIFVNADYQKVIDFMLVSGKRLATRAGKIADIGITKKDLTEEDLLIERGLKEIVTSFGSDHALYAEEENDVFQESKNVWAVDPISSTANFIKGLPHYAIVVAHVVNQQTVFGVAYDPSVRDLWVAHKGKGAFLNNQPIFVRSVPIGKIILKISPSLETSPLAEKLRLGLKNYRVESNSNSCAVNHGLVACGQYDGVIDLAKDSFPEFAGGLIVREAGGQFTNIEGQTEILPTDRIFIGGNKETYPKLFSLVKEVL